jgi:hypothetical protein
MSSGTAGSFSFNVQGTGGDGMVIDTPVAFTVYDFTISASTSAPVSAGHTANSTLTFTPLPSGTTFQGAVSNFGCSGLPALSNCLFGASQISGGSGVTTVTLTISTTAPVASLRPPLKRHRGSPLYAALLPVSGIALAFAGINKLAQRKRAVACVLGFVLALLMTTLQSGCGGGLTGGGTQPVPQPGTIPNSYPVTVTASEGPLTRSTTVMLTVQ